MLGPSLATWAANVVNFEPKLSNKMKKKTKQKQGRNGVEDKIKLIGNLGSINKNWIQT